MSDDSVIKTLCTKCGAVYELGREAIGQTATCGACNAEFEIQDYTDYINKMLSEQNADGAQTPEPVQGEAPEAVPEPVQEEAPEAVSEEPSAVPEPEVAEDGTVKMEPKSPTSTNTVKLSRVKVAGMLPQVEGERVKIATQTNKSLSCGTRKSTIGRKFSSGTNRKTVAPVAKKKSFWERLCFWKK